MMLCLDCGNTRLKWGLREQGRWLADGALALDQLATLQQALPADAALTRAVACNVAGAPRREAITAALPVAIEWIAARDRQCGVTNLYQQPGQLGADRWAALIGAHALHAGACLVVCAGTATTVDVLDADGTFQGGLILPGMDLMRRALAHNTAQLDDDAGSYQALPRNTRDAISSGTIHATLGAIERMFRRIADRPGATCILSGGAAAALETTLELPQRRIERLVLEGIARIAEEAQ